jgi:predicted nucleotidyltransferase component of viral defense system
MPELMDFSLAGGTALALYNGNRVSVDIDLFASREFDTEFILSALEHQFPDFQYSRPNAVGIFGFIGDIKVDFIRYHLYHLLAPLEVTDGVRIYSVKDIMAMKVAAIIKRAVKKDFWDIAEILEHFEVEELINCYKQKYPNQQLLITVPQAITY